MPERPAYMREGGAPSYLHDHHAGNVGDVWKHAALHAIVESTAEGPPRLFLECNAGAGEYGLKATGEWREGAARLPESAERESPLGRYLEFLRGAGFVPGSRYPGSPRLLSSAMRPIDRMVCFETESTVADRLVLSLSGAPNVEVRRRDGYEGLIGELNEAPSDWRVIAHIDPPWTQKSDWQRMPDLVARAAAARPRAIIVLWYPIKSYTRVAAMQKSLSARGIGMHIADLVTTPLEEKRNRLNGSGLLLVGAPEKAIEIISELAPRLGRLARIRERYWSFRLECR